MSRGLFDARAEGPRPLTKAHQAIAAILAVEVAQVLACPNTGLRMGALASVAALAHTDTPMAEKLVRAALGMVAAWPARKERAGAGEWVVAINEARAAVIQFFEWRAGLACDELLNQGGEHAA